MENYYPFGAVHIDRLKPCYLNLHKEQNKVLMAFSNAQVLKDEMQAFEHLEDVYMFIVSCKFLVYSFHEKIPFNLLQKYFHSKFKYGQGCRD